MKPSGTGVIAMLAVIVLVLPMIIACSSDGEEESNLQPIEKTEDVEITIGVISDKTGVTANAMGTIDMALQDLVAYYNKENVIPGVELRVITYDGQFDPAKDIAGYKWLREKGADLLFTGIPATSITLKHFLDEDEFMLFTPSASKEAIEPPGYVFSPSALPGDLTFTLLKWIAENDWNYEAQGPAKVGAALWSSPYDVSLAKGMEQYCKDHPDQFEWTGAYLTHFTFTWGPEVEMLGDCDYVMGVPAGWTSFIKEYRNAGHTAKFIAVDAHAAFFGLLDDANLWDEIDGALMIKVSRWWNEDDEMIDLAKRLLRENHPDSAEETIRQGAGYLAIETVNQMLQIIKDAVEAVEPDNFNSRALYEAAASFSREIGDGYGYSFGDTKRASIDYVAIYEARAVEEDIFRVHSQWYPLAPAPAE